MVFLGDDYVPARVVQHELSREMQRFDSYPREVQEAIRSRGMEAEEEWLDEREIAPMEGRKPRYPKP